MVAVSALCEQYLGIGLNDTLPWSIPEDFEFFLRRVRSTRDPSKINAIIMGRFTWLEGVEFGTAPYKRNLNLIVSTTMRKEDI